MMQHNECFIKSARACDSGKLLQLALPNCLKEVSSFPRSWLQSRKRDANHEQCYCDTKEECTITGCRLTHSVIASMMLVEGTDCLMQDTL